MKWVKRVIIVFDSQIPEDQLKTAKRSRYQILDLRLRSDGQMYFQTSISRNCSAEQSIREQCALEQTTWDIFLAESPDHESITESQFFSECDRHRELLDGSFI